MRVPVPSETRKGYWFPEIGVSDGSKSTLWVLGVHLGPLQEVQVLLTAEQSFGYTSESRQAYTT